MGFAALETSRDRGEPVSLFLFKFGGGSDDYYAYTNAEQPYPFQGISYEPIPITMGEIESSGTLDKAVLSVTLAENAGIVDLFRLRPPSSIVTLIVRQGHVNDPDADFIVGWSGRVTGFEIDGDTNEVTFGCEPISTSMQRTMLRRHWQYGCPHALYGPKCRAVRADHSTNQVVIGIAGAVVQLSQSWTTDALKIKHLGGVCEWIDDNGHRQIRRIIDATTAGTIKLSSFADGLSPGDSVTMVLACNHKTGIASLNDGGDCLPLFNNIRNFGGDPWIPLENPVGIKNNYY